MTSLTDLESSMAKLREFLGEGAFKAWGVLLEKAHKQGLRLRGRIERSGTVPDDFVFADSKDDFVIPATEVAVFLRAWLQFHQLAAGLERRLEAASARSFSGRAAQVERPPDSKAIPSPELMFSPACASYARSLIDPFTKGRGSGVCYGPCFPSVKLTTVVKGTFSLQASAASGDKNLGWIMVNPWAFTANDGSSVRYTNTTSTTTGLVTSGGISAASSPSPFAAAVFDSTTYNTKRLVSAGIRFRYRGTQLNMGGSAIGIAEPNHASLDNATPTVTSSVLKSNYQLVEVENPDRKFHSVTWQPINMEEMAYHNNTTRPSSLNAWNMAIMVDGPGTSASAVAGSYDYEVVVNWEVTGPAVASYSHTPCYSDSVGFSAIMAVDRDYSLHSEKELVREEKTLFQQASQAVLHGASGFGRYAALKARDAGLRAVSGVVSAAANNYFGSLVGRRYAHRHSITSGVVRGPRDRSIAPEDVVETITPAPEPAEAEREYGDGKPVIIPVGWQSPTVAEEYGNQWTEL